MELISIISDIITLATGLVGLIGTGVSVYFAVKNFINLNKEKSKNEIWTMIMSIADSAMNEAERSGKSGADKKTMVMDAVKAGCTSAGIDANLFIDQLSNYIDDTISFVNKMKTNSK